MENENIKVSIICTVFNHEPYIREAFEGFLMQKCDFDFEILVNDDASTDGSAQIMREYEKKYPDLFKMIYQKENLYSKGENVLTLMYEQARGEYLAICEGDDYWTDPNKLQKQVDFLEKNQDFYATYHNVYVVDEKSKLYPEKQFLHVLYKEHEVKFTDICNANYLCGQTATIVCRNFWKEFNEKKKNVFSNLKCNGDIALSTLFTNKGKVWYMEDVMANYRKSYSNDSYSATTVNKNMSEFYMNSALELQRMLKEVLNIDYRPELTQYAALAWGYWKNNKTKENRKIFTDILLKKCTVKDIFNYGMRRIRDKISGKSKYRWAPLVKD